MASNLSVTQIVVASVIATAAIVLFLLRLLLLMLHSRIVALTGRWGFKEWFAVDDMNSSAPFPENGGLRKAEALVFGAMKRPSGLCTRGLGIDPSTIGLDEMSEISPEQWEYLLRRLNELKPGQVSVRHVVPSGKEKSAITADMEYPSNDKPNR